MNYMEKHKWTQDFVNNGDIEHNSPLHVAATNGYDVITGMLIEKGACVKVKNEVKQTALHVAASNGQIKLVDSPQLCNRL